VDTQVSATHLAPVLVKQQSGTVTSTDSLMPAGVANKFTSMPNPRTAAVHSVAAVTPASVPSAKVSLTQATAAQLCRDIARSCGLPTVAFGTAEGLKDRFPELGSQNFRDDSIFVADPNSAQAKEFYKALNEFAADHGYAIVGIAMHNEFNHPFCLAPVSADGLGGQLMQMDATDPTMGCFSQGKKTRVKPGDPNFGTAFRNQIRALWLIPRDAALAAGNAKYQAAKLEVSHGVNCAEFASGLLHHLHKLDVAEFQKVEAANRAYVNPTGDPRHRGFATGLVDAVPHVIIQHTNPEWQAWATDPKNGAYLDQDGIAHTRDIELTAAYQDAVQV